MIRMIAAVRAAVTATVVLAGVPILLLTVGGSPLPSRVPSAAQAEAWLDDPLRPAYVPATARTIAWMLWALLAAVIATVILAKVRRWRWALLAAYLPGPVQGLAATLLGAATVTTAVGVPAHAAPPATATDTLPTTAFSKTAATGPNTATPAVHHHEPKNAGSTVEVRRGDTLWDIASDRLGDPGRWKQIHRLNSSRYPQMQGGKHIEPGWTLTLPATATAPQHRPTGPEPDSSRPAPGMTPSLSPAHTSGPPPPADPRGSTAGTATAPSSTAAGAATSMPNPNPQDTPGTGEPSPPGRDSRHEPSAGVSLPSGSWIDLGLATSIIAAAALVWRHRRRRYTRREPTPQLRLDDPDTAPMPPVVRQIRRRASSTATPTDPATPATGQPSTTTEGDTDDQRATTRTTGADSRDVPAPTAPAAAVRTDDSDPPPAAPRPVVPALTHPLSAVWPPAGLGLTGPGAHPAARGFLTAALATDHDHEPADQTQVIMPAATATALLDADGDAVPDTPRLKITAGLGEALDLIEQHTLHRTRIAAHHEVDTVAELRTTDPPGPALPPLLLLADTTDRHQHARVAALLDQGQRLDIHGILLGDWPDGDTVLVAADGTTTAAGTPARHGPHPADVARLAILTQAETRDLLLTLAEAHTGAAPSHADTQPTPEPACGDSKGLPDATGDSQGVNVRNVHLPPVGSRPEPPPVSQTRHEHAAAGDTVTAQDDNTGAPAESPAPDGLAASGTEHVASDAAAPAVSAFPETQKETGRTGRVDVTVLGPARIVDLPTGTAPRKKALEVLVYLAVHNGTASTETLLDDVLPDAPTSKAHGRLYTYISDLRRILHRTGGPGTYLTHPDHRYVLDHDKVQVDLWRMRDAIRDAEHAHDPDERITALRRAADTYTGPLADGADYEWIEPYREAVRRQALDVHLTLADALTGQPVEQITILDAAIRHHPYTEELYQQAMRAHAALGHLDAIRGLRRDLTRALADIDAEPSADTIALAGHLIADLQHAPPSAAPAPGQGAAA